MYYIPVVRNKIYRLFQSICVVITTKSMTYSENKQMKDAHKIITSVARQKHDLAIISIVVKFPSILLLFECQHANGFKPARCTHTVLIYLQAVVTYGSTYVLVALSIDRLDAIARPMNFSGSGTCTIYLIFS